MKEPTEITIYIAGLDDEGNVAAELYDAGLDDAVITQDRRGGNGAVETDIDETDIDALPETLARLRQRIESVGVRVTGFGPPALVSAAEIAARIGRTRQSVTMLIHGDRGPGGFPASVNPGGRSEHYDWVAVANWLQANGLADIPASSINAAAAIRDANRALQPMPA